MPAQCVLEEVGMVTCGCQELGPTVCQEGPGLMPRGVVKKSQHQGSCEAGAQNSQPGAEGWDGAEPQKHISWSLTGRTIKVCEQECMKVAWMSKNEQECMKVAPHYWSSSHLVYSSIKRHLLSTFGMPGTVSQAVTLDICWNWYLTRDSTISL